MKAILLPVLLLLQTSAIQLSEFEAKKNLDDYFEADMSSMAQLEASIENKETSNEPKESPSTKYPQYAPLEQVVAELDQSDQKKQKKIKQIKKKTQSLVQSKVKSDNKEKSKDDPIFGSLGPPAMAFTNNTKLNDELNFENEMRKKVPRSYQNSMGVVDTDDSIKWAEKELGEELVLPKKSQWAIDNGLSSDDSHNGNGTLPNITYEEDDEVSETLDSIHDAEQIWGYTDKYYYNHPWGMPESYPGAPGKPRYGYGGYGGYGRYGGHGHGNQEDKDKDGKDDKTGQTMGGHGGYGGYGGYGYGGYGRRYSADDRGGVPNNFNDRSEEKNKDWWNYLTKDNGENGMSPIMLNRTQLQNQGMYNDLYWLEHGMKDDQGREQLDKNGKHQHDLRDAPNDDSHEKTHNNRDEHGNHDDKKKETKHKNYNKNSKSGNGWLPPELDGSFARSNNAYEKKEEGENRRSKDKKSEATESDDEDEDKKEESDGDKKEGKEESKDSEDSDKKDDDKKEEEKKKPEESDKKEPKKELGEKKDLIKELGVAQKASKPLIPAKEESKSENRVQTKSKSLKQEESSSEDQEESSEDDGDDEEWVPEHPSISESVKLIPKEQPAPKKKEQKTQEIKKAKKPETKIENKQTDHQKQFSQKKKEAPKKEAPKEKKRVMVVDGAEIPMEDVEDPVGDEDPEKLDE